MLKMAVFEHKSTNIFSPNELTDLGIASPRLTSPNTTQNKCRKSWELSIEVDHRDLYLTPPNLADIAKMYVFFHRGPKSLLPTPTKVEISPTVVDTLCKIWVCDSGASLIFGTVNSDQENVKNLDFRLFFSKNYKKKHRKTFVISPGS